MSHATELLTGASEEIMDIINSVENARALYKFNALAGVLGTLLQIRNDLLDKKDIIEAQDQKPEK